MLNCPISYNEAVMRINNLVERVSDEDATRVADAINAINIKFYIDKNSNKAERNKAIAEYNGISVSDLISSPNMEYLESDYLNMVITEITKGVKTLELSLDDKDVWSLLVISQYS